MINVPVPRRSCWCSVPWPQGSKDITLTLWGPDGPWYSRDWEQWSVLERHLPLAASPGSNIPENSGKICVAKPVGSLQEKGPFSRSEVCLGPFLRKQKQRPA